MEPRQIWALLDGDRRRWSRITELVAWMVWKIEMNIPLSKHPAGHRYFSNWLKVNMPPGFIPPKKEQE